jgi:hypothetical protein
MGVSARAYVTFEVADLPGWKDLYRSGISRADGGVDVRGDVPPHFAVPTGTAGCGVGWELPTAEARPISLRGRGWTSPPACVVPNAVCSCSTASTPFLSPRNRTGRGLFTRASPSPPPGHRRLTRGMGSPRGVPHP